MTPLAVVLLAAAGLVAGLLLLRRIPLVAAGYGQAASRIPVSVIIPARNEAGNLPHLLPSLQSLPEGSEIIVVDDDSSDTTPLIAQQHGARVISTGPLPSDWRGKPWACWQGAQAAQHSTLLFLDADTRFTAGGAQRLCNRFASLPANTALSVLPYHRMQRAYEHLSLFFNLLMAMGAGGFGKVDEPHMFGQCMMMPQTLYQAIGGHASVRQQVLENMHMAEYVRQHDGRISTCGGKGVLEMRMFPEGFAQLHASWKKGFTDGAKTSSRQVLALAYLYLSGCTFVLICMAAFSGKARFAAALMYLAYATVIAWQSRQVGTYPVLTAILYPIPLAFYFATFGEAAAGKLSGKKVSWRGRDV